MIFRVKPLLHRTLFAVLTAGSFLTASSLFAQMGVAPSQTGLFFDDLRSRASQQREPAVDESGMRSSGIYDFEGEEFEGVQEGRPLGYRNPVGTDAARVMGYSGYQGATSRTAADFGGTTGPYPSTGSYFAPTYVSDPFLEGKRNIRLGPVNIGLGMNSNVEYNDNINRSSVDPKDAFIAGAMMNVDLNWQITEKNRLTLTTSFGVDHYFTNREFAPNGDDFVFNVAPGSTLAFDMMVGDVMFVFYDRFSMRPVSQNDFAVDSFDVFGSAENNAGVGMNWAINSKLNLSLNYNHANSWALEDAFAGFDRVTDTVAGSLAWTPTGTYTIGIEGSFSWINYDEGFNNDGTTSSVGVFAIVPITTKTILRASVGYQEFEFDSPPIFRRQVSEADIVLTENQLLAFNREFERLQKTQYLYTDINEFYLQVEAMEAQREQLQNLLTFQRLQKQRDDVTENSRTFDYSDLSDYYYNVTLFNQLTSRVSHQLSFGHESSLNTTSNFITADYISYGVGIVAWRGSTLSLSTYYEKGEESGGRLAEDTEQWGFDALLTHRLTNHITAGLGYHYGNTDSNLVLRDYDQHAISLDFTYSITQKMTLGLGYRFWTTNAENSDLDFDQNRFILSLMYNF